MDFDIDGTVNAVEVCITKLLPYYPDALLVRRSRFSCFDRPKFASVTRQKSGGFSPIDGSPQFPPRGPSPFRNVMKIIRVFVSSPGDVQAERTIADRVIQLTAEELGIPLSVQYSNLVRDRCGHRR